MAWGDMRMMPADVEDLQGFVPLINGKSTKQNWTGLFKPGERVRLRFINSSAMAYFDIRIPGLSMTVVAADGNNVRPVKVDELRIAVAETYDVIVQPKEDKAYSIVATSMGRSALGRGTLAPRYGMEGVVPELGQRPLLTMADMGMDHSMMDMSPKDAGSMKGMDHAAMGHTMPVAGAKADPFYAPGSGLTPVAANGGKFLSYTDLKAQKPLYEHRKATREIEMRLTGNMERYIWSVNGKKYENAEPLRFKYGERVRIKFINETMMSHPMHLHGMWSILDTGAGKWNPIKHTISVAPGTTVYMETEVDAPGQWAFHCHLSYHAASGMFHKVIVEGGPKIAQHDIQQ
jgi:FtsP/CotA-like multicopper oxidase with cupredoxin domain